ncbi:hyaluronoglucosaminidase, partial [Oesophagostomum dentatum]
DLSFHGEKIAIFYEFNFGSYPYYKGYNVSFPVNGGLPQNCNITAHLEIAKKNITDETPANFDGLGIIDFEEWRPLFDQNGYGSKQVFQNESIGQIKRDNAILLDNQVKELAAKAFNESAREFFLKTIQEAKNLRPKAKWGFYGFPYCNYNAGKEIGDYECSKQYRDWNDRMSFLFNASDALYPSIYLGFNATSEQRVRYIHAIINEARRISRKYKPPLPIYAYTKIEYDPLKKLNDFYDKNDLCASITQPANMGVDGIIFWSASANMTQRCQYIKKYMERWNWKSTSTFSLVKKIKEEHDLCRRQRCREHGKCILSHNTTCTVPFALPHGDCSCDCDYGYEGEYCSMMVTTTPVTAKEN